VFGCSFGKFHVVDAATKELMFSLKMNGSVEDLAFLNDGNQVLSFGDDGVVYNWDIRKRQCIGKFTDEVNDLLSKVFVQQHHRNHSFGEFAKVWRFR